ncbi:uncharacterized protein AruCF_5206 [Achromobacter ruhlandii]|nr:uncharacterized protein AruCF_5206 [Achromobacter ruhlandii]
MAVQVELDDRLRLVDGRDLAVKIRVPGVALATKEAPQGAGHWHGGSLGAIGIGSGGGRNHKVKTLAEHEPSFVILSDK